MDGFGFVQKSLKYQAFPLLLAGAAGKGFFYLLAAAAGPWAP